MRCVVFLGPSLPVAQARETLDAVYLPPIRQSDLLSALERYRPDAVGIVDGAWGQGQEVWHKEILYALDSGVAVFGAGSIGALRAVELTPFGMGGVGQVFAELSGMLYSDDDEVARAAEPLEDGQWRSVSEPMVNIRRLCHDALGPGVLSEADGAAITAAAKALHYPDRSWEGVFSAALAQGVSAAALDGLARFRDRNDSWDVMAADARAMLGEMARHRPAGEKRKADAYRQMQAFRARYDRERQVEQDGTPLSLLSIANHAALHWPDFSEENFNALNRGLVSILAGILGATVTAQEVDDEEKRFRLARRLRTAEDLDGWLAENHMDGHDLRLLLEEVALCRKLQRWMLTKRKYFERGTKLTLDQMRLTGDYPEWAARAAAQQGMLDTMLASEWDLPFSGEPLSRLVADHVKTRGLRWGVDFVTWATEAGFRPSLLRLELLRARAGRDQWQTLTDLMTETAPDPAPEHGDDDPHSEAD